jgi:hypothetical protein
MPNTEASFDELKARLAKTIDYCKTFKPAQIDGTENKDITIKLGSNERKFTGAGAAAKFHPAELLFSTAQPAYDILRHCGVELSKPRFYEHAGESLRTAGRGVAANQGCC